ncbi:glycosyltransferase family 2 protein [Enorma phocaeensis]|uniref:glycosyltransferase family 2 protein n=1 Tax=Enorma phocaeensis TaxID=1871019 RepID=UPI003207890C
MDSLYIVMPAYNEADNIEDTLAQWYPVVESVGNDSRLVVFDDGSKDETFSIMKIFASSHPLFIACTKKNTGHGGTVLHAYQYAVSCQADYVFQTDTDGQTDPEEFWQFWNLRHDYDMVIGQRKGRQDGLSRILVTKTLKCVVRILFGESIADANTPFRLMSSQTLRENIKLIPEGFNLSNVLLSVIYFKRKQKVKFIPITFKPRQGGVNSINLRKIVHIGRQALSDFSALNKVINKQLRSQ